MTDEINIDEALLILTAKAAMLERLVRLLLLDRLTERENPVETAKKLGEQMIHDTEKSMKGGINSAQALLAVENLQMFFDTLTHELSQGRDGSKSSSSS